MKPQASHNLIWCTAAEASEGGYVTTSDPARQQHAFVKPQDYKVNQFEIVTVHDSSTQIHSYIIGKPC